MKTEKQSAAAIASGQSKTAGAAAHSSAPYQAPSSPQPPLRPPSMGRRGAIVAGSVSLVTLGAWGMLSSALPTPSRLSNIATSSSTQSSTAENPSGVTYTLVPMSSEEHAAFRPTLTAGLASTNQEPSSRCPEAIARLALVSTPQSQGQIRITSGTYTTPWFTLAKGPMAFTIPFPAPYETGKGVLMVEGNAEHGVLSLTPGMELNFPSTTTVSIPVVWNVNANCR